MGTGGGIVAPAIPHSQFPSPVPCDQQMPNGIVTYIVLYGIERSTDPHEVTGNYVGPKP